MKTRPCAGLFGVMISSAFGLCSGAAARELWQQPAEHPARCGEPLAGKGAAEAQQRWGVRAVPRFDHGITGGGGQVENGGQPYADAQIDAALVRTGVVPPQRRCGRRARSKAGRWLPRHPGAGAISATQQTVGQAHRAMPSRSRACGGRWR
jgi:hypothetical protein